MIYVTEDREVECELLRVRSKLITLGRGGGGRKGAMAGEFM